jgi:CDP-ribitol ribitolphosphotransferase
VIQLWHAGGALKRFGYDAEDDIPGGYRGKVYKNYDLVTVSSEQVIKYFASAMHLPESCFVPWGLSRTDCFFDKDYCSRIRESFYKRYPGACGKKIVLWAPTFRGNAGDPRVIGAADIDRAAELTKKDYFMIRSLHPHMREKESADAFFCAEELLVVADILITDYSSILFDFLLFGRPVIRFTPDYGEYCRDRGFYMPYESLPGRQVCDGGELEAAIRSAGDEYDAGAARSIRDYAMGACDGKATSRVIRYIKNGGHNK